jgi:hypothetical protein
LNFPQLILLWIFIFILFWGGGAKGIKQANMSTKFKQNEIRAVRNK